MNTGRNSKQTTCLCRDTGGKGTLPAQHTTFNTLDNWGHKKPTQLKKKRTGTKGYRVIARNLYTIHSVTSIIIHLKRDSDCNENEKDNSEKQLEGKSQQRVCVYIFVHACVSLCVGRWVVMWA